jgi:type I site-specific restriction-modification system R (restriction) subunit
MTITIELPKNKKEADFVLQLLQKLNLRIIATDELSHELKQRLEERLADLKQNPHDVILWKDIKKQDLQAETA